MALNHVSDHESHCLKTSHKIQMYTTSSLNSIYHLAFPHRVLAFSPFLKQVPSCLRAFALLAPSTSPDLHMFYCFPRFLCFLIVYSLF